MNSIEFLLGQIKEFQERTYKDVQEMREEIKDLQRVRWKQAGSLMILSVMGGGMASFAIALITGK